MRLGIQPQRKNSTISWILVRLERAQAIIKYFGLEVMPLEWT
jgi:hypothetical protein